MRVDIYNSVFLKRDGSPVVNVGGIETLIRYLIPLLEELGYETTIYQCGIKEFETRFGASTVLGYPFPDRTPVEIILEEFRKISSKRTGTEDRIEIFGADHFSIPNDNPMAIAIQNGVWWDQPIKALTHKRIFHNKYGALVFRLKKQFQMLHLFENCYNRVCTDLNFVNWYRTCRGGIKGRVWYNPNPTPIVSWDNRRDAPKEVDEPIRIIFARRFLVQKGTRLIASVFKSLLKLRPNVELTLAGEGPERAYLLEQFSQEPRVTITSYRIDEVMDVLGRHDIAVIPSLVSESTCLSVVEAMGAGCAVVATNYGGITNQIIDGFNGLLAWPTEESLLEQIVKLVDSPEERVRIQKRGWETAQTSFSLENWRERWTVILQEVVDGKEAARKDMAERL